MHKNCLKTAGRKLNGEKAPAVLKSPDSHSLRSGRLTAGANSIIPPGFPELLLIEWPKSEKALTKYWFAWFGSKQVEICRVVAVAKACWRIDLDYREIKEELALDHFEWRHWLGWHHHVTLVTIAYAFLKAEQTHIKKTSGVTLPQVRRSLQGAFIGLAFSSFSVLFSSSFLSASVLFRS